MFDSLAPRPGMTTVPFRRSSVDRVLNRTSPQQRNRIKDLPHTETREKVITQIFMTSRFVPKQNLCGGKLIFRVLWDKLLGFGGNVNVRYPVLGTGYVSIMTSESRKFIIDIDRGDS